MNLKARIATIVGTLVLSVGGAVALAAPASAAVYPHQITMNGLCLEASSPGALGSQLRLNTCTGRSNQVFVFEDAGFDWGYFLYPANSGLCLQPGAPSLFNSTIVQWYCDWSGPQTWVLGFAPDSRRILYTTYSRWCVGVDNAFAGAYVRQTNCDGPGRRWDIV